MFMLNILNFIDLIDFGACDIELEESVILIER